LSPKINKKCGIYLIRNVISGLCYVGQSADIDTRWIQHKSLLRRQSERLKAGVPLSRVDRHLVFSWAKYGEIAFEFLVLEECTQEVLTQRETYWLELFRDIYEMPVANSEGPVDNPMRGSKHKPETLLKMSEASKRLIRTEEHKRRIGDAHRGKVLSTEQRRRLSEAKTGMKCPWLIGDNNPSRRPGARDHLRGSANPVHKPGVKERIGSTNSKAVFDVSSGEYWKSVSAAAAYLGVSVTAVSNVILGKSKTCKGRLLSFDDPLVSRKQP
jgi:group I intron endonuclease